MCNRTAFPVALLLAVFFGQTFFSMQTKAPTCDEFAHHTASGFSHLVTRDFRMNPAAPPLPRLLSAIPLYFLGLKAPSMIYLGTGAIAPHLPRNSSTRMGFLRIRSSFGHACRSFYCRWSLDILFFCGPMNYLAKRVGSRPWSFLPFAPTLSRIRDLRHQTYP